MRKIHRFALGLVLALITVFLAAIFTACGGEKATLRYEVNLPEVRSEADISGEVPKSVTVGVGDSVTVADAGTLAVRGCRFTGWTDGVTTYQAGDIIELYANTALRAKWLVGYADKAGGNDAIFIEGETVTFTYHGQTASFFYIEGVSEYSFRLGDVLCRLVLDDATMTYEVSSSGTNANQFVLYDAYRDELNFERVFVFDTLNREVDIVGYSLADQGILWAWGTYAPIDGTDEYQLTVVEDNSYLGIPNYRFKMGTPVTRSESGSSYTYNTIVVYDEEQAGEFIGEGITLTLDGYGYATLSDNGHDTLGTAYIYEKEVAGEVVDFKDASGNVTIYAITRGNPDTIEVIGAEVGSYQIYDPIEGTFGRQKLVLDGHGNVTILYGPAYNVKETAAYGTYKKLPDGNYVLTITEVVVEDVLPDFFVSGMHFRLTTLDDGYGTLIFLVYTNVLAGTFTSADGATLTLDGFGRAVYEKGSERYEGDAYYDEETGLVTVARSETDFRIYRIDGTTFREMGQEIGSYFLYQSTDGLDPYSILYLDGEGCVQLLTYSGEQYETTATGTYTSTGKADEWHLSVSGNSYMVLIQNLFFGYDENYSEIYYPVYVVYEDVLAGSYTGVDGRTTLVLDGYGINGVYTDLLGDQYQGHFERAGSIVVLTDFTTGTVFTFRLDGELFSRATASAGIYYEYYRDADMIVDEARIVLDGDGGAIYITGHGKNTLSVAGTVTQTDGEYTFEPLSGSDIASFKFRLDEARGYGVFVRYNEMWAGEFSVVNENGAATLVLDGYGNAVFTRASGVVNSACLVQGSDGSLVVFTDEHNNFRFLLDRNGGTARRLLEDAEQGYYYYYEGDFVTGTLRLFLGGDGYAEIALYNEETYLYEVVSRGTYAALEGKENEYTYTPSAQEEGANAFDFKLQTAYGYNVFSMADTGGDVGGTYTRTVSVLGYERTETLELDGYGTATYSFYDRDDGRERVLTGPYTIESNQITVTVYSSDGAYVVYTLVFELNDDNTFTVISEDIYPN